MNYLCHRGYWKNASEKNSLPALRRALVRGFGIETDIRDFDGRLVVSHDPPTANNFIELKDFLTFYSTLEQSPVLALNVKSDGLQAKLHEIISQYSIKNYFFFDMSIPDLLAYRNLDMPFAIRMSEFEARSPLYNEARWVWLDAFESDWFTIGLINNLLQDGKSVAVVSPELHGRPHETLWHALREVSGNKALHLCTDYLDTAMEFFNAE